MRLLITLTLTMLFLLSCEQKYNSSRNFTFTYNVEIESTDNKKLELWLPIPQSNQVQIISNLNISSDGLKFEIKDENQHGNKYLYINDRNGTSVSKIVTISFDVLRNEHQNIIYSKVNSNQYLSSSSMIPVGGMFDNVIKDNNLTSDSLRNLYDFVLSGMHYGKPKSENNLYYKDPWLTADGEYGMKKVSRDEVVSLYKYAKSTNGEYTFGNGNSIYACDIGVGNCTDYHSYFISLARTLDVPSRFHMGFSIPDIEGGSIEGYHCWADYYIDAKGWYPVDISEADKNPEQAEYFFGTVNSNRFEMMVGRDFFLQGYEDKYVNIFIYPLLEIDDRKSNAFKKHFSFKSK